MQDKQPTSSPSARLLAVSPVSDEDTQALPVKALEPAINFYQSVLGFSVIHRAATIAMLSRDGVEIGLMVRRDHDPRRAGSLAFKIDDLETMHREMEQSGGRPGEFGTDEWGGQSHRNFFLREDEDGYCYCFYQPLLNTLNDAQWPDVLQGLKRSDFSRLEAFFTPDFTPEGARSRILEWYEQGAFDNAEFFLRKGVDVAAGTGTGLSAFHWAANRGNLATVKLLLEHHSPLEMKNRYGGTVLSGTLWSALHERLRADHLPIIEALLAAGAHVEPDWQPELAELRRRAGTNDEKE